MIYEFELSIWIWNWILRIWFMNLNSEYDLLIWAKNMNKEYEYRIVCILQLMNWIIIWIWNWILQWMNWIIIIIIIIMNCMILVLRI